MPIFLIQNSSSRLVYILQNSDSCLIGHVNNIPTMQFSTVISGNTLSKSYMLSLTERHWEFQNNTLWDTHYNESYLELAICKLGSQGI